MNNRVRLSPRDRRAQIVRGAIAVIADFGYRAATFARIAQRTGLSSKGLISYHFDDRDELMREVVATVLQDIDHYVGQRMDAQPGPFAAVAECIAASIDYHVKFPRQAAALSAVLQNLRQADGRLEFGPEIHEPQIAQLQQLMRRAQLLGEMGAFDTRVAAVSLRQMIDGAISEVRFGGADPATYTAELTRFFTTATGPTEPAGRPAGRRRTLATTEAVAPSAEN